MFLYSYGLDVVSVSGKIVGMPPIYAADAIADMPGFAWVSLGGTKRPAINPPGFALGQRWLHDAIWKWQIPHCGVCGDYARGFPLFHAGGDHLEFSECRVEFLD